MKREQGTQSQKLMVFVLTMSLYGLATLFTELIPKFQVGIVEFSVEFFLFIPLVLAMLFDPLSAAFGAATGELVFSEIMLGQFGGLGEIEKFVTVTLGVYIAGRLVRNPKNQKMVGIAAMIGTGAQLFMGMAGERWRMYGASAAPPVHFMRPAPPLGMSKKGTFCRGGT